MVEMLWSVDTNEKYGVVQNFFGVGSSPLGGRRFGHRDGGREAPRRISRLPPETWIAFRPNGSAVVAFDLATGKERWKCGDDLASYSSPRTDGDRRRNVRVAVRPRRLDWRLIRLRAEFAGDSIIGLPFLRVSTR